MSGIEPAEAEIFRARCFQTAENHSTRPGWHQPFAKPFNAFGNSIHAASGGAMKRRDTQLRAKRFQVEDLKRRTTTLDSMHSDLGRKLADLEDSVARERQRSNDSDIGRLAFPSFLRSIESRRENLRNSLKEVEREREQCQQELADAYQGLKSLEAAAEQQLRRASGNGEQRVQSQFDEAALVRHLRKHALRRA
jgi:chromosome segregation ATPase